MPEHIDVLREAARLLDNTHIIRRLERWPNRELGGDLRVAFVGRGAHKTQLIHRLIGRDDTLAVPMPVAVTYVRRATEGAIVHLTDGSAIATHIDDLPVAVAGRQVAGATVTSAAVPQDVQWCDTTALNAFTEAADRATLRTLRRCDAVVLVVAANVPLTDADAAILQQGAVLEAHVPIISVVITGAVGLAAGERTRALTAVEEMVGRISAPVTVSIEPAPDDEAYPQWRQSFITARLPESLDEPRQAQSDAQLCDIGERLAVAADRLAMAEYRQAGTEDSKLAEIQTRAEWLLDAGTVRRELQGRRQRTVATANEDLEKVVAELVDETYAALSATSGERADVDSALDELEARIDGALSEAREQFRNTVDADVAWLDKRLRAYVEAWSPPTQREPHHDRLIPSEMPGQRFERCIPLMQQSLAAEWVDAPLRAFAVVALERAIAVLSSRTGPSVESLGSPARPTRRFALTTASGRFGWTGPSGRFALIGPAGRDTAAAVEEPDPMHRHITAWAQRRPGRRGLDGDPVTPPTADPALPNGAALTAATAQLYDALAEAFETARRQWRRSQQDNASRERGTAGLQWQGLAERIRRWPRTAKAEPAAATGVTDVAAPAVADAPAPAKAETPSAEPETVSIEIPTSYLEIPTS